MLARGVAHERGFQVPSRPPVWHEARIDARIRAQHGSRQPRSRLASIDGRATAARVRAEVAARSPCGRAPGVTPGLAVVLVGEDPASQVYVRNKGKPTREAGMRSFEHRLPARRPEAELLALVARAERRRGRPRHPGPAAAAASRSTSRRCSTRIDPDKDVDGFHPSTSAGWRTRRRASSPARRSAA